MSAYRTADRARAESLCDVWWHAWVLEQALEPTWHRLQTASVHDLAAARGGALRAFHQADAGAHAMAERYVDMLEEACERARRNLPRWVVGPAASTIAQAFPDFPVFAATTSTSRSRHPQAYAETIDALTAWAGGRGVPIVARPAQRLDAIDLYAWAPTPMVASIRPERHDRGYESIFAARLTASHPIALFQTYPPIAQTRQWNWLEEFHSPNHAALQRAFRIRCAPDTRELPTITDVVANLLVQLARDGSSQLELCSPSVVLRVCTQDREAQWAAAVELMSMLSDPTRVALTASGVEPDSTEPTPDSWEDASRAGPKDRSTIRRLLSHIHEQSGHGRR